MDIEKLSLEDLAIYISDHLRKNGIETVLSGGACVSIYTENKFLSYDLDFVLLSYEQRGRLKSVLADIGFFLEGRHYRHKDTPFLAEFLSPPLSIGAEPVKNISRIQKGKRFLALLSPTDCVKDRLAAYYHWGDRQSLDQALLVSRDTHIDLEEIKKWSAKEGMEIKFGEFLTALEKASQKTRRK